MSTNFAMALLLLLNASRADVQAPAFREDPVLSARAQERAERMCASRSFSHDGYRIAFQGSPYRSMGENLAQGHQDPRAVHAQLMNSPGHRANILNRDATRVGVGVVYDPASREILVTQLFSRPPEKLGAHTVDELRRGLLDARRAHKLRPLERDAALDELAQSTAREIAQHGMSTAQAGKRIDDELSRQGRWSGGRTVFAVVSSAAQAVDSLANAIGDASVTHVGVGVEAGRRKEGGTGLYVVIVLATLR